MIETGQRTAIIQQENAEADKQKACTAWLKNLSRQTKAHSVCCFDNGQMDRNFSASLLGNASLFSQQTEFRKEKSELKIEKVTPFRTFVCRNDNRKSIAVSKVKASLC